MVMLIWCFELLKFVYYYHRDNIIREILTPGDGDNDGWDTLDDDEDDDNDEEDVEDKEVDDNANDGTLSMLMIGMIMYDERVAGSNRS